MTGLSILEEFAEDGDMNTNFNEQNELELSKYLIETRDKISSDPCHFWEKIKNRYLRLANMAQKYLSAPPDST